MLRLQSLGSGHDTLSFTVTLVHVSEEVQEGTAPLLQSSRVLTEEWSHQLWCLMAVSVTVKLLVLLLNRKAALVLDLSKLC